MAILLSDEELWSLYEQNEFYFKLYVFAIRRYMDYKTGIVGIKRRISYQSLREEMFVASRKGFNKNECEPPDKPKLQRAIKHFVKIGLLEQIPNKNHLVFRCVLAKQDNSVQNIPDTVSIHQVDTKADTAKLFSNPGVARAFDNNKVKADTKANTPKNSIPDTPPLSGKDKEKELLRSSKKKSQLPNTFDVNEQHIHLARQNNWPDPRTEIDSFKDYHLARATTFADWDRAFYTWLRNAKKFQGVKRENHQAAGGTNSMSRAIDNILNSPSRSAR